jgi:regulatory protein
VGAPGRSADRRAAVEARRARRAETTDVDAVMEAAAAFLAVRPRSVAEVRRRLRHLGYPLSLGDAVVDRLVDLGYLDDRVFAKAWVESRDRARPRGALALRRELTLKGVPRDLVDEVLEERAGGVGPESTGADLIAAAQLLTRRGAVLAREPDPRRRRHKAYALLARHGFTPDVCRKAATDALGADPESADPDA